jgi:predicted 3-demethylubiquinone-9 3-methyltransferase (glyoxalase superfamily)
VEDLVPFVRFCGDQHGNAEEAVTWYCSPFPDSRLLRLDRDGPAEREREETVRSASFELGGKPMMAIDSTGPRNFTFTPAISTWVGCSTSAEIESLLAAPR